VAGQQRHAIAHPVRDRPRELLSQQHIGRRDEVGDSPSPRSAVAVTEAELEEQSQMLVVVGEHPVVQQLCVARLGTRAEEPAGEHISVAVRRLVVLPTAEQSGEDRERGGVSGEVPSVVGVGAGMQECLDDVERLRLAHRPPGVRRVHQERPPERAARGVGMVGAEMLAQPVRVAQNRRRGRVVDDVGVRLQGRAGAVEVRRCAGPRLADRAHEPMRRGFVVRGCGRDPRPPGDGANVRLQSWPTGEPVFTGDDTVGVGEAEGAVADRDRRPEERVGVTGANPTLEVTRLAAEPVDVRSFGKGRHRDLLSRPRGPRDRARRGDYGQDSHHRAGGLSPLRGPGGVLRAAGDDTAIPRGGTPSER
jgi:hypothetical protein